MIRPDVIFSRLSEPMSEAVLDRLAQSLWADGVTAYTMVKPANGHPHLGLVLEVEKGPGREIGVWLCAIYRVRMDVKYTSMAATRMQQSAVCAWCDRNLPEIEAKIRKLGISPFKLSTSSTPLVD